MTVQEVLDTEIFKEEVEKMISAYKRHQPGLGVSFKRTHFDALIEAKEFNVEFLRDEFTRIDTGVSDKPANTRREIARFVIIAAKNAYKRIEANNRIFNGEKEANK